MKTTKDSFRTGTMSKYGKLNFDRSIGPKGLREIDALLRDIKNMEGHKTQKRRSVSEAQILNSRLLSPNKYVRKTKHRGLPKPKVIKKGPTFPQAKEIETVPDGPGNAQYDPDYSAILTKSALTSISSLHKQVDIDPNTMTMNEMMYQWENNIRAAFVKNDNKPLPKHVPASTLLPPPTKVPGLISCEATDRDSFIKKANIPSPVKYTISRSLDKPRTMAFEKQAPRPEPPIEPDRAHAGLGRSIDATKPRPLCLVSMAKQVGRESEKTDVDSVWAEIELEQQMLMQALQPEQEKIVKKTTKKEPFSLQTTNFNKGPFDNFIKSEAPKDRIYDVEGNLAKLENTRILPRNFGRRLSDTDRTIYVKTDGPDAIYCNVNDAYKLIAPSSGPGPNISQMPDRRSAYDYMPTTCGGDYVNVEEKFDYRTPCIMDKMGERKLINEVPPQFTQGRASSLVAGVFGNI